ncbi:hypothetical protein V6N13_031877 [Hibiscus sabdariffa]|uniref:Uncharacterized protein n=1 Tax=Hibiscus sabdariffa TaxID=183260 RepID=A0ABR2AQS6_9ROSI
MISALLNDRPPGGRGSFRGFFDHVLVLLRSLDVLFLTLSLTIVSSSVLTIVPTPSPEKKQCFLLIVAVNAVMFRVVISSSRSIPCQLKKKRKGQSQSGDMKKGFAKVEGSESKPPRIHVWENVPNGMLIRC